MGKFKDVYEFDDVIKEIAGNTYLVTISQLNSRSWAVSIYTKGKSKPFVKVLYRQDDSIVLICLTKKWYQVVAPKEAILLVNKIKEALEMELQQTQMFDLKKNKILSFLKDLGSRIWTFQLKNKTNSGKALRLT